MKSLLFKCLILLSSFVSGKEIVCNNNSEHLKIGKYCEYLIDENSGKGVLDILNQGGFTPCNKSVPNFSASQGIVWIKFAVFNPEMAKELIVDIQYPLLDEVTIYKIKTNTIVDSVQIGRNHPFTKRKFQNQNLMYLLNLSQNEHCQILLKVKSSIQILLPIDIVSVYETLQELSFRDLISGIYFGIMLVMLFYNLIIFVNTQDKNYLYYSLYVLAITYTQAVLIGFDIRYLYPDYQYIVTYTVNFAGVISGIATILFAQIFLNTKKYTPVFHEVFNIFIVMYCICGLLSILGYRTFAYHWIDLNAGLSAILGLLSSWLCFKRGNKSGLFFLINWSIFLVFVAVYVLKDYGILPFNLFTFNGLQIGSAIEATLFSIALANRINLLRKEKDASQARELLATLENEKIIKEQNVLLEQRVEERTFALNESKDQLQITLENLKAAQAQLIHSEKMASLGQLTAGVAHEINNPINFVISSVSPLKRDLDDMIKILETYEKLKSNTENLEQRFAEIESLKRKLDLDYLKEEIQMLLKGITEGANRTAEIVRGLKNFSRLDESDFKDADIREGLDSTLLLLNNELGNIEVIRNYEEIDTIECFPGQLNQVFMNILNNAIYAIKKRHTTYGGQLTLSIRVIDDYVNVVIEDNGIGMSQEVINKVFEPFYTTKKTGEGTGLGMSITYQIVEKHEGRIFVESELGIGTKFLIYLPKKINHS